MYTSNLGMNVKRDLYCPYNFHKQCFNAILFMKIKMSNLHTYSGYSMYINFDFELVL